MHMHVNNVPPVPEDHLLPAIGSLPFPLSSTFARVPCLFQKQVSSLPAGDDPTNSSPTYHLAQQDTEQRGSSSCDEEQLSSGGDEEEEALVQDGRVNLRGPLKSHVPMQALRKVFALPRAKAAQLLDMSVNCLKRLCRKRGIERWPHRKLLSLDRLARCAHSRAGGDTAAHGLLECIAQQREAVLDNPNHDIDDALLAARTAAYKRSYAAKKKGGSSMAAAAPAAVGGECPAGSEQGGGGEAMCMDEQGGQQLLQVSPCIGGAGAARQPDMGAYGLAARGAVQQQWGSPGRGLNLHPGATSHMGGGEWMKHAGSRLSPDVLVMDHEHERGSGSGCEAAHSGPGCHSGSRSTGGGLPTGTGAARMTASCVHGSAPSSAPPRASGTNTQLPVARQRPGVWGPAGGAVHDQVPAGASDPACRGLASGLLAQTREQLRHADARDNSGMGAHSVLSAANLQLVSPPAWPASRGLASMWGIPPDLAHAVSVDSGASPTHAASAPPPSCDDDPLAAALPGAKHRQWVR
mmetsp:Transcript_315/g.793  ORF Transcript_315/g.793 Transcript_315/m.793 type:complete len:521 (-) Transcript_315:583-2145(-)